MLEGFGVFLLVLLVLVVIGIFKAITTVPQGFEYTVERFGRYTKTLGPGLSIIVPFIDRIGAKMNMMEQVLDVPTQEVITKDNAMVQVDGVVFYQVLDAAKAAYEVNQPGECHPQPDHDQHPHGDGLDGPRRAAVPARRDQRRLLRVVDEATTPWGVKITRIEIKDINPPRDLVDSMARQMKAERDKRAAILEAEGVRAGRDPAGRGRKAGHHPGGRGRREAAFRDAEARERCAEAEAKATRMVSEAIAAGDVQAINYFVAQKYIEALESLAKSPEPEGADAAGRGIQRDRLHRRHRRDRARGLRRRQ